MLSLVILVIGQSQASAGNAGLVAQGRDRMTVENAGFK